MDFLFIVLIWIIIFVILLLIFYFFYSKKKKFEINKKIKTIDSESKLIAIDELRRLVKKNPTNYQAREKLAELLAENKSYLPSIKEYLIILDRFEEIDKLDEIKILNKIGDIYLKLGNFEDAKKYYLISKSKDDLNIYTNLKLAEIEVHDGNYEKAETFFDMAYKIEPENLEIVKSYAICDFKTNRYKSALEKLLKVYNTFKTDDEKNNEVYYYLGYSLFYLNKFNDAITVFSKLKRSKEYSSEAFYIVGKIHKEQRSYINAIEDFENSTMSNPSMDHSRLLEIYYLIADCYFKSHNIQKSIEYWTKITAINPNYEDVQAKLENYSSVHSNQFLEIYLLGSINQFTKICKLIINYYVHHFSSLKGNIKYSESKTNQDGTFEILSEVASGNFIETNYFVFIRSTTTVGDITMRMLYNRLKEQKADKGVCITAGNFSESAKEFVESRMIKIIEREELVQILNSIGKNLNRNK